MPPEFVRKIESEIRKPEMEIKKGAELNEETKEATLHFLESHTKGAEISEKDKDSLAKAIKQLEAGESYGEIVKWLKRPSPIEKGFIEETGKLKKGQEMGGKNDKKKNKKELCMIESQLHIYLVARSKLIGKFKKLEEKDI